jgi:hypothetical protein
MLDMSVIDISESQTLTLLWCRLQTIQEAYSIRPRVSSDRIALGNSSFLFRKPLFVLAHRLGRDKFGSSTGERIWCS